MGGSSVLWTIRLGCAIALACGVTALSTPAALAGPASFSSAGQRHVLKGGQSLLAGQQLRSLNGSYELLMQTNGNLVEYGPSGAVWATGTPASGNRATMQTDGNFVVYTSTGTALWQSGTGGSSGTFTLNLQNNGNLVLKQNGIAIWTRQSSLSAGSPDQTLSSGQSIWSPNGSYELLMQTNGNLVEYGPSGAVWGTGTPASGNRATMQADGNFVVYTSNGTALWQSGTGGNSGKGGFVLDLDNEGNLAIYGVDGLGVMWTRESSLSAGSPDQSLSAGQSIWSPNGAYELIMQTDGNLVEYGSSGALWATGTSGSNNHVTMQTDGNLVIYSSGGSALWASDTGGNSGGFVLDLQNDSNLVIYGVHGGAIWNREGGGPPLTYGKWPETSGPGAAHLYYGYPYADPPACTDGGSCVLDKWDFYQGQCTSWVAYRLNQLNGIPFTDSYKGDGTWGDATNWGPHARALGIAVNGTPAVGSVAWYSSGHVAYVEQVNSPISIVISEMNYDFDNGFWVHTITTSSDWPTSFIHIADR
jgi:surface antigen